MTVVSLIAKGPKVWVHVYIKRRILRGQKDIFFLLPLADPACCQLCIEAPLSQLLAHGYSLGREEHVNTLTQNQRL